MKIKLVSLFVALSLCITWFYNTRQWALGNRYNTLTPYAFTGLISGTTSDRFQTVPICWQTRIGSIWASSQLVNYFHPTTANQFENIFGFYHAAWLFITFLLLILFLPEPTYIIFATFAGMIYASLVATYSPLIDDIHYLPWDMPAMTFFTFAFLLWQRGYYKWMLIIIFVGNFFKETTALTAILYFFTNINWKSRIGYFIQAFIGCLIIRFLITKMWCGGFNLFAAGHDNHLNLFNNLIGFCRFELTPHLNTILWVNGGMALMILFLYPITIKEWGIFITLLLFYLSLTASQVICSNAHYEARQWGDMLPVMAIYFRQKLLNKNLTLPT